MRKQACSKEDPTWRTELNICHILKIGKATVWVLTCLYFHPSVNKNNIGLNIRNSLYFVTKGKSYQRVTAALFSAYIYQQIHIHTYIHTQIYSQSPGEKSGRKLPNSLREYLTVNQRCYKIKITICTQFSLNLKNKILKDFGQGMVKKA